jgi:hypothetical protein
MLGHFHPSCGDVTTAIIKSLVLALVLVGTAFAQDAFERPTPLNAADLAPNDLLGGPHYKVAPEARIEGYLPTFKVQSDFGDFSAVGVEMLRVRVSEVPAIGSLAEASKSDAFANALGKTPYAVDETTKLGFGATEFKNERDSKMGGDFRHVYQRHRAIFGAGRRRDAARAGKSAKRDQPEPWSGGS